MTNLIDYIMLLHDAWCFGKFQIKEFIMMSILFLEAL